MPQIGYTPLALPWPVAGTLSAPDRLQLLTRFRRVRSATDDVVLALTLAGPGTQPTAAGGALPGALVQLSPTAQSVGISLDTSGAWPAGDGLRRAVVRARGVSLSGPAVVPPAAFLRVQTAGATCVVRVGTRVAPLRAATLYTLDADLLSEEGLRRTVRLAALLVTAD